MPRITLEKRIPVGNGISEIREATFEIPTQIVYNGEYMTYDNYNQAYWNIPQTLSLSAIEYIKMNLEYNKQRKDVGKGKQNIQDSLEK